MGSEVSKPKKKQQDFQDLRERVLALEEDFLKYLKPSDVLFDIQGLDDCFIEKICQTETKDRRQAAKDLLTKILEDADLLPKFIYALEMKGYQRFIGPINGEYVLKGVKFGQEYFEFIISFLKGELIDVLDTLHVSVYLYERDCLLKSDKDYIQAVYSTQGRAAACKELLVAVRRRKENWALLLMKAIKETQEYVKFKMDPSSTREDLIRTGVVVDSTNRIAALFKRPLENKTVMEGLQVTFECEAENPYHVVWYKDGDKISPSSNIKIEALHSKVHKLTILKTTLEDKGKYEIKIKDTLCGAVLDVKALFKRPLENKTVMEGLQVTFECEAEKPYHVVWYKDGDKISPSSNIKIEALHSRVHKLTILKTTLEDKGKYEIKMKDALCGAVLDVKESVQKLQSQVPAKSPLQLIEIKLKQKLKLSTLETFLSDCLIIVNQIIFIDFNKLLVYNFDGSLNRKISLSGVSYSMSEVSNDTVAVSYGGNCRIEIVNIKTGKVKKEMKTNCSCWGISYQKKFLYILMDNEMIDVMDMSLKVIRSFPSPSSKIKYITIYKDRLLLTDCHDSTVYCSDLKGQPIWKFKNKSVKDMDRLSTDQHGNVYVAGFLSQNIIVISNDGKDYKELITKSDELSSLTGCFYDKSKNYLLVCGIMGHGYLYDILNNF